MLDLVCSLKEDFCLVKYAATRGRNIDLRVQVRVKVVEIPLLVLNFGARAELMKFGSSDAIVGDGVLQKGYKEVLLERH